MFTGIIEAIGRIADIKQNGGEWRIATGSLDLSDVQLGDSISVNGVCLTVTALPGDGFCADISAETLACTTFATRQVGDAVNIEKSLTLQQRLSGHLVSGHIDGVGEVVDRHPQNQSICLQIRAPDSLAKYIANKGSISIDGTSLTVNKVSGNEFAITIVPHTLANTIIDGYQRGTQVNLEVDMIARYVERLLQIS